MIVSIFFPILWQREILQCFVSMWDSNIWLAGRMSTKFAHNEMLFQFELIIIIMYTCHVSTYKMRGIVHSKPFLTKYSKINFEETERITLALWSEYFDIAFHLTYWKCGSKRSVFGCFIIGLTSLKSFSGLWRSFLQLFEPVRHENIAAFW